MYATTCPQSKEDIMQKYSTLFGEGVGLLAVTIQLDPSVPAVQHAPRRVPVALREQLKSELNELVSDGIIAPTSEPTEWISSLVVVRKKNGKLRLCLDPQDLNRAVLREHYQLPTIEDVATRLHGAKVFTTLDVSKAFWSIKLSNQSSYMCTFNTPFGRYRWLRLPYGLSSAPEIFQRRMHEVVEGLHGTEVIADDFVVVGFGETHDAALHDHDVNLEAFLERCMQKALKLNAEKCKFRQTEVPFIGHIATDKGLKVQPERVRAIIDMPKPTDTAGVQRLLGMVQYLEKFLPHLSSVTQPLRELTQKDVEFVWQHPQEKAISELKQMLSRAPVLRYYNPSEPVMVQCDASKSGLGATLMQGGQPVAFASRSMTAAETRYAQIEKELLAIQWACHKFDIYLFGRDVVHVESDHKPLENIFKKNLADAPLRLQRMLLKLQRYNVQVTYKRGAEMYIADTLSRSFLDYTPSDIDDSGDDEELFEVKQLEEALNIPMSQERLKNFLTATENDETLTELRHVIQNGWPDQKSKVISCITPFWDYRHELFIHRGLVMKGDRIIVPVSLRKEMMNLIHSTHIGIDACLRRARECLFWPRMNSELREFVGSCDVCLSYRPDLPKEPLLSHEVPSRPWAKIAADLCEFDGRQLLVVVDYFSNFIEVERLHTTTTRAVTRVLSAMLARYGSADTLVTDNGPQFTSSEFAAFCAEWQINDVTSSPHFPQCNGKTEAAVKTVKCLFRKCKESGISEFRALLDWRNTPTEGMTSSPSQRFMGRRCKTLLPTTSRLLHPRFETEQTTRELCGRQAAQKIHYDKTAHALDPLQPGDTVRMRLPGCDRWYLLDLSRS